MLAPCLEWYYALVIGLHFIGLQHEAWLPSAAPALGLVLGAAAADEDRVTARAAPVEAVAGQALEGGDCELGGPGVEVE